jgi:Tol biopolymer transport system component
VANDTNGITNDIFVRDLQMGTTTLVSVNRFGTGSGSGESGSPPFISPAISADGRYVVFSSLASDLVANDTNGTFDVFVRDLQMGTTALVSVNRFGTGSGNSASFFSPVISADGRFVAFPSLASDLVANDTNGTNDVFVRDLQMGTTVLVSVNQFGTGSGNGSSPPTPQPSRYVISADGRFVAFQSEASDLVANDTNGTTDVFVRPVAP